jgi:uncharacterized protein (DUF1330 family)
MSFIITQIIYIMEGEENIFLQFENIAIPLINKYNGRLLLRIRPDKYHIIESTIDNPYEIHIIEFNSEIDFHNFMKDEERKKILHLKEQSVKSVIMIKGMEI